jgi:hypothetical protein
MTTSEKKKPKKKKEEIDFTNVTADDIARRVLATPPKPKTIKRKID